MTLPSPRPWRIDHDGIRDARGYRVCLMAYRCRGTSMRIPLEERLANEQLIVHAVNTSHRRNPKC